MHSPTAACSSAIRRRKYRRTSRSRCGSGSSWRDWPSRPVAGGVPDACANSRAASNTTSTLSAARPVGAAIRWAAVRAIARSRSGARLAPVEAPRRFPERYWETADGAIPRSSAARRSGSPNETTSSRAMSACASCTQPVAERRLPGIGRPLRPAILADERRWAFRIDDQPAAPRRVGGVRRPSQRFLGRIEGGSHRRRFTRIRRGGPADLKGFGPNGRSGREGFPSRSSPQARCPQ